jgi:hypothetical protein
MGGGGMGQLSLRLADEGEGEIKQLGLKNGLNGFFI